MPLIDLAVFDVAGTTVRDRDNVNLCVQEALRAAGFEVELPAINATMGIPKPIAIELLLRDSGFDGDIPEIHRDFVERMKAYYRSSPEVGPIEGVEAAFAELRASGIKVTLDTGFSREITEVILERLGWDQTVIDGAVSSDEVENGRPAPDMVFHHMRAFGISDAMRVAKIGDAPADLNEGTNAGCGLVVGVLCGTHTREQLSHYPHTHLIDSVADFPALVLEAYV